MMTKLTSVKVSFKFCSASKEILTLSVTLAADELMKSKLDGGLPANPVNDRRVANAVTLKSTFCPPQNQQLFKNI